MTLVFPTPASPITRNLITGELSAVAAIDTFDDVVSFPISDVFAA